MPAIGPFHSVGDAVRFPPPADTISSALPFERFHHHPVAALEQPPGQRATHPSHAQHRDVHAGLLITVN